MHAAVVTAFDVPPRYEEVPDPVAHGDDEMVVDVLAAGLHPRVRSQADGSHYSSTGDLPLVPGIDGVVRDADGRLRYAILDDTSIGTMAQRTVIDRDRSVVVPDDVDPVVLAAAMNPAMSSWVALRRRVTFRPGQSVLVLGATGNAGRMAVQVARLFGASRVIGAARDVAALPSLIPLGADEALPLDRVADAADVDVVIDYLWGEPAAAAMVALAMARPDRGRPLMWIRSDRSPVLPAPFPRPLCAPPVCRSSEAASARCRVVTGRRNCRNWWRRSHMARSTSARRPSR